MYEGRLEDAAAAAALFKPTRDMDFLEILLGQS